MTRLYQIRGAHFTAGFEADTLPMPTNDGEISGVVTRTAPILTYMKHWGLSRVREYCVKKKWKLEEVEMV